MTLSESPACTTLWRARPPERAAVYAQGSMRWLEFGHGTVQTRIDLDAPHELILPYTQALATGLLVQPAPRAALLLGLGGGAVAHFLLHHLPRLEVHAVESSASVIDASRRFFSLPDSPRLRVERADARRVAARGGRDYDLVVLDVFDEAGLPAWVLEPSTHAHLRDRLRAGGVLAANVWVGSAEEFVAVCGAVREAFSGQVLALPVPGYRNLVILAIRDAPATLSLASLRARAREWQARTGIAFCARVDDLAAANLRDGDDLLL